MPFVVTRVNVPLSEAQETELKERFGCAIAHVPGKSEAGLLLAFEGNARLWLAGDDAPLAYVEASVFANEGHYGYEALVADCCSALQDVLGIPPLCHALPHSGMRSVHGGMSYRYCASVVSDGIIG